MRWSRTVPDSPGWSAGQSLHHRVLRRQVRDDGAEPHNVLQLDKPSREAVELLDDRAQLLDARSWPRGPLAQDRGQGVLKEMARLRQSRGELLLELVEKAQILIARRARP
jgi:hypothetical protein